MRLIFTLLIALAAHAQRTAQVCPFAGSTTGCTTLETSRIGNLRFEDYRVTNPNAPLVNVDVRRAHLTQIPAATRTQICTANPNAGPILNAPSIRFAAVEANVSEVESVGSSGQLVQEVFAQVNIQGLVLSDGFSVPNFAFRLTRNRGSNLIQVAFDPAFQPQGSAIPEYDARYVYSIDPIGNTVTFLTPLPANAQVLRLFWSVSLNMANIIGTNAVIRIQTPPPFERPLFTADDVRALAANVGRVIRLYASPIFAPVAEATCTAQPFTPCAPQAALQSFGDFLALNGSEYLATGSTTPLRNVVSNLAAWARAEALRTVSPANAQLILKPITLFWPTMRADANTPVADRDVIDAWLARISRDADDRTLASASLRIHAAIQQRDHRTFAEMVERYWVTINTLRADGSIPEEAQRGPCALSYTNLAISHLVTIAEAAASQGYDLYSLTTNTRNLDTAITFLLDAYDNPALIARYNNPAADCYLVNSAPMERRALELAANQPSPAAWIDIYLSRFPSSALANRLRTRTALGTSVARRPLYHHAPGVNASCLFLAPQELNPQVLPNFDIISGDGQTGTINTPLAEPLRVRVRSNGGLPLGNILVQFAITSGTGTLAQTSALTDPLGIASTRLTIGPRSGPITINATALGLAPLTFRLSATGDDPLVAAGGIVGVSGSVPPVRNAAPGAILSIYGANFVPVGMGRRVRAEEFVNGRLPTQFLGICVTFDTTLAPLLDVLPNQINLVVPALSGPSAVVRVKRSCGQPNEQVADEQRIAITNAAPEFFFLQANASGVNPIAAVEATTNGLRGPSNLFPGGVIRAARPGEVITAYLNGLGPTQTPVVPGAAATSVNPVRSTFSLELGNTTILPADILYVGFSPGSLIYQINFRIPLDMQPGSQPIRLTIDGQQTPAGAFLTVGSL